MMLEDFINSFIYPFFKNIVGCNFTTTLFRYNVLRFIYLFVDFFSNIATCLGILFHGLIFI